MTVALNVSFPPIADISFPGQHVAMKATDKECWFAIESPQPEIQTIVVGKYLGGFKIDIHGVDPSAYFEGGDTVQDRISEVIKTLRPYVGPDAQWVECDTRQPIHVWDALAALSKLEEW